MLPARVAPTLREGDARRSRIWEPTSQHSTSSHFFLNHHRNAAPGWLALLLFLATLWLPQAKADHPWADRVGVEIELAELAARKIVLDLRLDQTKAVSPSMRKILRDADRPAILSAVMHSDGKLRKNVDRIHQILTDLRVNADSDAEKQRVVLEEAWMRRLQLAHQVDEWVTLCEGPLGEPLSFWPTGAGLILPGLGAFLVFLVSLISLTKRREQNTFTLARFFAHFLALLLLLATLIYGTTLVYAQMGGVRRQIDRAELASRRSLREELARSVVDLEDKLKAHRAELLTSQANDLGFTVEELRRLEGDIDERLTELQLLRARIATFTDQTNSLNQQTQTLGQQLSEHQTQVGDGLRQRAILRIVTVVAVYALAASPWYLTALLRLFRRSLKNTSCPRCEAPLGLNAAQGGLACRKCEYRIPKEHAQRRPLCFPLIGTAGSGKTHWLVAVYDRLTHGAVNHEIELRGVVSHEDIRYRADARRLQSRGQGPSPGTFSQEEVPYPLLLCGSKGKRKGVLVHLFDFAAWATDRPLPQSPARQRALKMDGLLLFLNPLASADSQLRLIEQVAFELRQVHDIPAEKPLSVSVAICLSHLDQLPQQSEAGEIAALWLESFREGPEPLRSLAELVERSISVRLFLPMLFPGQPILQVLDRHFPQAFFFPLSPIGLDPKREASTPFALFEPILWLLAQKGEPTFPMTGDAT
jgi:hypothetical protein